MYQGCAALYNTRMSSRLDQVTTQTAASLRSVAQSQPLRQLSRLTLPEIDKVVEMTAQILPAGNVPGMILSGLARLPEKRLPRATVEQHLRALFSGVEQALDTLTFAAAFAGPAAVLGAYQNLLKLAGKTTEEAFPEGIWQFYVEYALREDSARHVNETHGFDTILRQHQIHLNESDRQTAWVMAAIMGIHQYDALLEIEWRERIATRLLREISAGLPQAAEFAGLYRAWEIQRPYRRGAEAASYDYPDYRRIKFDHFLQEAMRDLPANLRAAWAGQLREAEKELPAYQRQMSILAYLDPGEHSETRVAYPFDQAKIGLIVRGNYFTLPVYDPANGQPLNVDTVRAQVAALLALPGAAPANLTALARIRRAAWPGLRKNLTPGLIQSLDELRFAPILINADTRPANLPLTAIRQAERGIGSHALTIFQTEESFVFDQSHIFFDGILGAALAEILTNEALSWAVHLQTLPAPRPAVQALYTPLVFPITAADAETLKKAPRATPESGAENDRVNLRACQALRKQLKQRNAALTLTVNDLLALYRAMHAGRYQPSAALSAELKALAARPESRPIAVEIARALEEARHQNPSLLIPMDASRHSPRERLYPLSLEAPLLELDLPGLHQRALRSLEAYQTSSGEDPALYQAFAQNQRQYLAALSGLGLIFNRLKEIAIAGESASVSAIKMLAHLPPALQTWLDGLPARVGMLNDLLKGREVFSNVGAVVASSTLRRFVSAKDDNEQKQLVWGLITGADGVLRLSLRDFRPHVAALQAIGRADLAQKITQDYLDAYAEGFNRYLAELQRIVLTGAQK
ncbi:MAG: hypothetical protein Fur0035_13960 [Anaerolineales bacterium]